MERIQERTQVAGVRVHSINALGRIALPKPSQIRRNDLSETTQTVNLRQPHGVIERVAMDQEQGDTLSGLNIMQVDSIDQRPHPCLLFLQPWPRL
jgi:hypothetical protein